MKLIRTLHRFNTGRFYIEDRQPIAWAVLERDNATACTICGRYTTRQCVVFRDEARWIEGVIDLHMGNLDFIDDEWVLRAYDDHHWHWGACELHFFSNLLAADAAAKEA
jgi:hypothetical protein